MTRPTKIQWTPLQNIWLQVVWEAGYHISMIASESGRTEIAIQSRIRVKGYLRPPGCLGLGAKEMQAKLKPMPPYPGGRPAVPRPARAENRTKKRPDGSHSASAAKEPPEDGWKRRCAACEGIFRTDDVEEVVCADCRGVPQKTDSRTLVNVHVRRARLDRRDTWLSR